MAKKLRIKEEVCPDCNGRLRYLENEIYCIKCGLVVDDSPFDFATDEFEDKLDDKRTQRTGKPMTYLDGFGGQLRLPPTIISKTYRKKK